MAEYTVKFSTGDTVMISKEVIGHIPYLKDMADECEGDATEMPLPISSDKVSFAAFSELIKLVVIETSEKRHERLVELINSRYEMVKDMVIATQFLCMTAIGKEIDKALVSVLGNLTITEALERHIVGDVNPVRIGQNYLAQENKLLGSARYICGNNASTDEDVNVRTKHNKKIQFRARTEFNPSLTLHSINVQFERSKLDKPFTKEMVEADNAVKSIVIGKITMEPEPMDDYTDEQYGLIRALIDVKANPSEIAATRLANVEKTLADAMKARADLMPK